MKRNAVNSNLDTALLGCGFRNRRCTQGLSVWGFKGAEVNATEFKADGSRTNNHIENIIPHIQCEDNTQSYILTPKNERTDFMINQFIAGQIFAPILPITRRRTLAYVLSRDDNTITIAECGQVHTVEIQVNQAFGNEFVKINGRDDDFVISAPCALTGKELIKASSQIAEKARALARGE